MRRRRVCEPRICISWTSSSSLHVAILVRQVVPVLSQLECCFFPSQHFAKSAPVVPAWPALGFLSLLIRHMRRVSRGISGTSSSAILSITKRFSRSTPSISWIAPRRMACLMSKRWWVFSFAPATGCFETSSGESSRIRWTIHTVHAADISSKSFLRFGGCWGRSCLPRPPGSQVDVELTIGANNVHHKGDFVYRFLVSTNDWQINLRDLTLDGAAVKCTVDCTYNVCMYTVGGTVHELTDKDLL